MFQPTGRDTARLAGRDCAKSVAQKGHDMLTVYGVPLSVHTRKVLMTAMHKGLDHKLEVVIPVIPGNRPANWSRLSPTELIPAIQDGEITLADSTAICLYLVKKYSSAPIMPANDRLYGRALWFDAYAGGTLFRHVVHPLFHQRVVAPKIRKVATDQAAVDTVLNEVQPKIFSYLESQIEDEFLVGRSLTLADVAVASNLLTYRYIGFPVSADRYPKLSRYLSGIFDLDLFQRAIAQEKPFVEQMGLDRSFLQ
jgi:glutathione S-transferase